jgi:hypothetical protein
MRIERWAVDDCITGAAMPTCMTTAAVAQAGDVADEDLVRAETVSVRPGVGGWVIHRSVVVCAAGSCHRAYPGP